MRKSRPVAIAALAALPMSVLEVWSLSLVAKEFSRGGADLRALIFLALVQGGILIAIVVGVMGVVRRQPQFSVYAAILIFLEAVPLIFSFAWLAVLVSGLFLLAARDTAPLRGPALVAARVLGSVAAFWALACVPSMLSNNPPLFLVFLVVALCGVVAVSWWPAPDAVEEVHP